jgi:hypothetical protein
MENINMLQLTKLYLTMFSFFIMPLILISEPASAEERIVKYTEEFEVCNLDIIGKSFPKDVICLEVGNRSALGSSDQGFYQSILQPFKNPDPIPNTPFYRPHLEKAQALANQFKASNTFTVYRTDEVYKKEEVDNKDKALEATIRSEVRDSVTTALKNLDARLFTPEIKRQLTEAIATSLDTKLKEQEDRLRAEFLAEIERRLPQSPITDSP